MQNINDPKLTAYALGELTGAEEEEMTRRLAEDAAARAEVDAIREAALVLREGLAEDVVPALTEAQRARIEEAALEGPARGWQRARRILPWSVVAAAAGVALVAFLTMRINSGRGVDLAALPAETQEEECPAAERSESIKGNDLQGAGLTSKSEATSRHREHGDALATSAPVIMEEKKVSDRKSFSPRPPMAAPAAKKNPIAKPKSISSLRRIGRHELKGGETVPGKPSPRPVSARKQVPLAVGMMAAAKSPQAGMGANATRIARKETLSFADVAANDGVARKADREVGREGYDPLSRNPFRRVADAPLSTFSIDVDTASYSNVRRFLNRGMLPPVDAVRIEEMVNYFRYAYAPPQGKDPFAVHVDVARCPWAREHRLVRIGLKGRVPAPGSRPPSNLVFLLDVSGSMQSRDKLPLLKAGLKMLVHQLGENDRVAIVVYAGASGVVLPSTPANRKEVILDALDRLRSGGSTNGGAGIELAYRIAVQNSIRGGINRVILATDGDFNVGITDRGSLIRLIEEKATTGVFLTVLGFGTGNLQDATMENLADKGNGMYAYIDSEKEARKVLVEQLGSTLQTIAKDVKIQVEFNPAKALAYRLIGYENRLLRQEDFQDDTKDAGEIGAGHTVTAFYEVIPVGVAGTDVPPQVAGLRYQTERGLSDKAAVANELMLVKLRYKPVDGDKSLLLRTPVADRTESWEKTSDDFQFASAVALFGMLLRHSPDIGKATFDTVLELAGPAAQVDPYGARTEFMELVRKAKALTSKP